MEHGRRRASRKYLREAEVDQDDRAIGPHHDVLELKIEVDDAA